MSFFERNREILQKQYPGLLEEITSLNNEHQPDLQDSFTAEDIKIETSPSGDPVINIKGIHIHSPRDPVREGQRLASTACGSPIVILGFGLGYTAQALANVIPGQPVIIVENNKNLLLKALELRDLTDFLSKNKIIFVIGGTGEGVTSALAVSRDIMSAQNCGQDAGEMKPVVIRNKALVSLDEKWYRAVEDRIRTWTMRDDVNTATHKRFGQRWVSNLSHNMDAIRDYPGVSHLVGLASGESVENFLPVFLAAAGPGLDVIKPILGDIYERCIIVAVDTNLRFFVKNGIQPDFVVVVDPQFWNSRHLDRCVCSQTALKTALVAESAVYPPVLRLPFKNKFLCGSLFPLGEYIEKLVDPKGRLGAGGSVATTAWDFARSLGTREIWIAGLDLAFPELKTHFKGARFEELSNTNSSRFNPIENWVTRALRDGFPFKAKSSTGADILTDRRLSLYAAWFENQFRQHPEVQNYSLSRDALAISGIQAAAIQDLLAMPQRRSEINCRLGEVYAKLNDDFFAGDISSKRAQCYEKAISGLTRGLDSIKDASEKGASIARQALKGNLSSEQQKKVLRDLDAIMRRVTQSEVKEVAGFLFPKGEEEKNEKDSFQAYLKSALKLFSGLADAVDSTSIFGKGKG
jgi:hypothetical protein